MARTGARRMADIDPDTLRALNSGRLASANLIEWLAMDFGTLLPAVTEDIGLPIAPQRLAQFRADVAGQKALQRSRLAGELLNEVTPADQDAWHTVEALLAHPSDAAREWAAQMIGLRHGLPLDERLERLRPLADDAHHGVREMAWIVFRPHLANYLDTGLGLLARWAISEHANVRRFASEVSRPIGVWCAHLAALKTAPERALDVLRPLFSDDSKYVQTSVGNWLNDASKSRPDWVMNLTAAWLTESDTAATQWIVKHARRTLRKQGLCA